MMPPDRRRKNYPSAVCAALLAAALSSVVAAQPASAPANIEERKMAQEAQIERERLAQQSAIESKKLEVEKQKLQVEREKLTAQREQTLWTARSIVASVLIPLLAVVVSLWWQARTAFQIKAAEIVFAAYSPWAAQGRIKVLRRMFPWQLGTKFAESFDPNEFPGTKLTELKLELFRAMAEKSPDRETLVELWRDIFPNERRWFDELFPPTSPP